MSAASPKLTIVIIAYNEEAYIGPCLDAITAQTVAPDEVIVVNNNSKDRTVEIASSYPFVTVINETKQGMIPARNAGLNAAQGPLIGRIDADTHLTPNWVERVHKLMDEHANEISALSGPAIFYGTGSWFTDRLLGFLVFRGFQLGSRLMLGHQGLFGSNMIITKKAWAKVQGEICDKEQDVHEDIDLAIHIGQYGTIQFDKHLLVGVARRGFNTTSIAGVKKGFATVTWRLRTWVKSVTRHRRLFVGLPRKTS